MSETALVQAALSQLTSETKVITFPQTFELNDAKIAEDFFRDLAEKAKGLKSIFLSPATPELLQGLTAYAKSATAPLPALVIDSVNDLADLTPLLSALSQHPGNSVKIQSGQADWESLPSWIDEEDEGCEAHRITVEITLPDPSSDTQASIDQLIEENQILQRCESWNAETGSAPTQTEAELGDHRLEKSKRTRARSKADDHIAISQEVQESVAQSVQQSVAIQLKKASLADGATVFQFNAFDAFFKALTEEELNIDPAHYLLTKRKARALWDNFFGHRRYIKCFEKYQGTLVTHELTHELALHQGLFGISQTALEVLLSHSDEVWQGIDLKHLPQGFRLVEINRGELVLDFDKQAAHKTSLVTLTQSPEALRLSRATFESLIDKGSIQDHLNTFWQNLRDKSPYSREATHLFLEHALRLNALDQDAFEKLTTLCGGLKNEEGRTRFKLLLEETERILELGKKDDSPIEKIVIKNYDDTATFHQADPEFTEYKSPGLLHLKKVFSEKALQAVFKYAQALSNCKREIAIQLDDELQNLVSNFEEKYNIHFNRSALLKLEATLPQIGIEQFIGQLSDLPEFLIQNLNTHYLQHSENYFVCLDPEFKLALETIKSFNEKEYQWWEALFSKHSARHIDLPTLVKSFNQFLQAITEKNLQLYQLPENPFQEITNMQVGMAQILTVLNSCDPRDIKEQWEVVAALKITHADLMRDLNQERAYCSIVLPILQVKESRNDLQNIILNIAKENNPQAFSLDHLEAAPPLEGINKIKKDFFSQLSKERHRFPIKFYQDAFETVVNAYLNHDKESLDVIQHFMDILIKSSTGNNYLENRDEEFARKNWGNFFDTMQDFRKKISSLGMIKKIIPNFPSESTILIELLNNLKYLSSFPDLATLQNFYGSLIKSFLKLNLFKIPSVIKIVQDAEECFDKLIQHVDHFGQAVYQGMRFYQIENIDISDQQNKLYQYLKTLIVWKDYFYSILKKYIPNLELTHFIQLFSTFDMLDGNDVDASIENLHEAFEGLTQKIPEYLAIRLLSHLSHIEKNVKSDGSPLSIDDLLVLMNDFQSSKNKDEITQKDIANYLKNHASLQGCFSNGFFEQLNVSNALSDTQKQSLSAQFDQALKEKVDGFWQKLQSAEASHRDRVFDKLKTLLSHLPEEKRSVAIDLFSHRAFFEDGSLLAIETFETLVDAVLNRGQIDDLVYYLNGVETSSIDQAVFYLNEVVPEVNAMANQTVSRLEILPLLHSAVLKSSAEQLKGLEKKPEVLVHEAQPSDLQQPHGPDASSHSGEPPQELQAKKKPSFFAKIKKAWGHFSSNPQKKSKEKIIASDEVQNKTEPKFSTPIEDYCTILIQLSEKQDKSLVLEYFKYLTKNFEGEANLVLDLTEHGSKLKAFFDLFDNIDLPRALLYHSLPSSDKEAVFSLRDLLNHQGFDQLSNQAKIAVCQCMAALLNAGRYDPEKFNFLISFANDPVKYVYLEKFYREAPFPSLEDLKKWDEELIGSIQNDNNSEEKAVLHDEDTSEHGNISEHGSTDPDSNQSELDQNQYAEKIQSAYEAFDKSPFPRSNDNQFDIDFASTQAKSFVGYSFSEETLQAFQAKITTARDLSTAALKANLARFKNGTAHSEPDFAELVALSAELLYRSTGQELNTTQYLSVLATLASGRHSLNEVATGEGKSRITAVLTGCHFALGCKVDLLTSDMQLAMRDYLSYLAYYNLLGAKTNLLSADMDPAIYADLDICLSDFNQLTLFRNKSRALGNAGLSLHQDKKKRALLVDEADLMLYDMDHVSFNYAANATPGEMGMTWIYPILVQFFEQDDPSEYQIIENLYWDDIDGCNLAFRQFAQTKCTEEQFAALKKISDHQIETWHEATMAARSRKFDTHFKIDSKAAVLGKHGTELVSKVLVHDIRTDRHSHFSQGVHQLLSARLELLRQKKLTRKTHDSDALMAEIEQCDHPFLIEEEKKIVYRSSSKDTLDEYDEGYLRMLTGTAGSYAELIESRAFYSEKDKEPLALLNTPRHRGLKREYQATYLARDFEKQCDALFEYILESYKKSQPVLIFCEDDAQSKAYLEAMNARLAKLPQKPQIQQIIDTGRYEEEEAAIKEAGKPGMVTIASPIAGRGTDIKLVDSATQHGLNVLLTYLPRSRGLEQMVGRSARFGQKGEARLVLNKAALKKQLGKKSLRDGFYTQTESYLRSAQSQADKLAQNKRLIVWVERDFNQQLRKAFFEDYLERKPLSGEKLLYWSTFLGEQTDLWTKFQRDILSLPLKTDADFDLAQSKLNDYQQSVQIKWTAFRNALGANDNSLVENLKGLKLTDQSKALLKRDSVETKEASIYKGYDKAQAGRAALYEEAGASLPWFLGGQREWLANYKAWKADRGILWANLRAWWRGDMSFGQYLRSFALINWIASWFKPLSPNDPPQSALRKFAPLFKIAQKRAEAEPETKADPEEEAVAAQSDTRSQHSDNLSDAHSSKTDSDDDSRGEHPDSLDLAGTASDDQSISDPQTPSPSSN